MDGQKYAGEVVNADREYQQVQNHQTAARAYPVQEEYGGLQKAIATLDDTANELQQRLSYVLSPSRPEKDSGETGTPREALSPLAESIRTDTDSAYRVNAILRDILQRLEIPS